MPNAHEGYVSWERPRRSARWSASNVPTSRHHGAPKHGDALLAGLLRCRRCGRKLTLRYTGAQHHIPRYSCSRGWMDNGEPRCIAFGGLRVDDAIEEALLGVVGPGADRGGDRRREAKPDSGAIRCARRSAAISKRRAMPPTAPSANTTPPIRPTGWWPANWRRAGTRRSRASARSRARSPPMMRAVPTRQVRPDVARPRWRPNLKTVWSAPTTDARLKKRIVRTADPGGRRRYRRRQPPRSFWSSTGSAAFTARCACPSAGAASATAPPPTSSPPCASWC